MFGSPTSADTKRSWWSDRLWPSSWGKLRLPTAQRRVGDGEPTGQEADAAAAVRLFADDGDEVCARRVTSRDDAVGDAVAAVGDGDQPGDVRSDDRRGGAHHVGAGQADLAGHVGRREGGVGGGDRRGDQAVHRRHRAADPGERLGGVAHQHVEHRVGGDVGRRHPGVGLGLRLRCRPGRGGGGERAGDRVVDRLGEPVLVDLLDDVAVGRGADLEGAVGGREQTGGRRAVGGEDDRAVGLALDPAGPRLPAVHAARARDDVDDQRGVVEQVELHHAVGGAGDRRRRGRRPRPARRRSTAPPPVLSAPSPATTTGGAGSVGGAPPDAAPGTATTAVTPSAASTTSGRQRIAMSPPRGQCRSPPPAPDWAARYPTSLAGSGVVPPGHRPPGRRGG